MNLLEVNPDFLNGHEVGKKPPLTFEAPHDAMRNMHAYGIAVASGNALPGVKFQAGEAGDQERARAYFEILLRMRNGGNGQLNPESQMIHFARVARDYNFTYAREAREIFCNGGVDKKPLHYLKRSWAGFEQSLAVTQELFEGAEERGFNDSEDEAYLYAEHGMTIGAMARVAALGSIMGFNSNNPEEYFISADLNLHRGSNIYYLVSNASRWAAWSIADKKPDIAGKAAGIAEWALHNASKDNPNYAAALAAFDKARVSFVSPSAARQYILDRP
jgi:hypothetical protein